MKKNKIKTIIGSAIWTTVDTPKFFLLPLNDKFIISVDKVEICPSPMKYTGAYKPIEINIPTTKERKMAFFINGSLILKNISKFDF